MTQRCILSTCGNAYAVMKGVCDHSFEDKTAGKQCMNYFNAKNIKKLQICEEYDNGFFGFNKYKESGLVPGSYVIAEGSLPSPLVDAEIDSVSVANRKVTIALVSTTDSSIADVAEAMGCKNINDMCTVVIMYPKPDGFYGFGAVRFTYVSGATILESFAVAVMDDIKSATLSITSNTLKVELRTVYSLATGATVNNTYMAAIASRMVNGSWRRSNAQFLVEDATPTFAQAIATYPVGQERFLNGGGGAGTVTPSGGGGGGDDGGDDGDDDGDGD